jgi:hypothetical protein
MLARSVLLLKKSSKSTTILTDIIEIVALLSVLPQFSRLMRIRTQMNRKTFQNTFC